MLLLRVVKPVCVIVFLAYLGMNLRGVKETRRGENTANEFRVSGHIRTWDRPKDGVNESETTLHSS
jgi:hypothetical protein